MDMALELTMEARFLVAALLGALIGLERELHGRDAGIRTYAAVGMAVAFGMYLTATTTAIVTLVILLLHHAPFLSNRHHLPNDVKEDVG